MCLYYNNEIASLNKNVVGALVVDNKVNKQTQLEQLRQKGGMARHRSFWKGGRGNGTGLWSLSLAPSPSPSLVLLHPSPAAVATKLELSR